MEGQALAIAVVASIGPTFMGLGAVLAARKTNAKLAGNGRGDHTAMLERIDIRTESIEGWIVAHEQRHVSDARG